MDERDAGLDSYDAETRLLHDSVLHAAGPFDGEVEGHPGLRYQARPGPPGLTGRDAVDGAEGPAERLGGGVAVLDGHGQQAQVVGENVGRRDRHAPAAGVVPDRHARQRRERTAKVVLAGASPGGHNREVHRLAVGDGSFDNVQRGVELLQHHVSFPVARPSSRRGHCPHPTRTVPDRSAPMPIASWSRPRLRLSHQRPGNGSGRFPGCVASPPPDSRAGHTDLRRWLVSKERGEVRHGERDGAALGRVHETLLQQRVPCR